MNYSLDNLGVFSHVKNLLMLLCDKKHVSSQSLFSNVDHILSPLEISILQDMF